MKNETTTVKDMFIKKEYSLINLVRAYNKATDNNNNKLLEVIINNLLFYLYLYTNNKNSKYQAKLNHCEHLLNVFVECDTSELAKYVQKEYRDFRFYITSTY